MCTCGRSGAIKELAKCLPEHASKGFREFLYSHPVSYCGSHPRTDSEYKHSLHAVTRLQQLAQVAFVTVLPDCVVNASAGNVCVVDDVDQADKVGVIQQPQQ